MSSRIHGVFCEFLLSLFACGHTHASALSVGLTTISVFILFKENPEILSNLHHNIRLPVEPFLERVRGSVDRHLVELARHELQSHGQVVRRAPARHRHRGMAAEIELRAVRASFAGFAEPGLTANSFWEVSHRSNHPPTPKRLALRQFQYLIKIL